MSDWSLINMKHSKKLRQIFLHMKVLWKVVDRSQITYIGKRKKFKKKKKEKMKYEKFLIVKNLLTFMVTCIQMILVKKENETTLLKTFVKPAWLSVPFLMSVPGEDRLCKAFWDCKVYLKKQYEIEWKTIFYTSMIIFTWILISLVLRISISPGKHINTFPVQKWNVVIVCLH